MIRTSIRSIFTTVQKCFIVFLIFPSNLRNFFHRKILLKDIICYSDGIGDIIKAMQINDCNISFDLIGFQILQEILEESSSSASSDLTMEF